MYKNNLNLLLSQLLSVMKFFRYKQVARLTFLGIDDEYDNVASSYSNTKTKLYNNTEFNTKLLRFRINNFNNIKLSQNPAHPRLAGPIQVAPADCLPSPLLRRPR